MAKKSSSDVNQLLRELCDIDAKIFVANKRKQEIDRASSEYRTQLELQQARLNEAESAAKEGNLHQVLEEQRLKDEQIAMVQRRKQLTTVGGAKGAKLMERELDTATKTIQAMEERAMKAIEEADELEERLASLRDTVSEIEQRLQSHVEDTKDDLEEVTATLAADTKERDKILDGLDDRLQRLYNRVAGRYPGDAVAFASKGSCRSCYRSLPPQTYNQVLAGNLLIQCPGCQRLIVASAEALAEVSAA
ncbi:MAG: hypothetical protein KDD66_04585 [Bdellovibrionales bacterium]|nr:hypothetical protein [Bdellovibrionales bacterium]